MHRQRLGRWLLLGGVAALLLAAVALGVPIHAGTGECGSVASPGPDAETGTCPDQQRVLLAGGGVALVAGAGLLISGRRFRSAEQGREAVGPGEGGLELGGDPE